LDLRIAFRLALDTGTNLIVRETSYLVKLVLVKGRAIVKQGWECFGICTEMAAIPMTSLASLWLVPNGLGIGVASERGTGAEVRWGIPQRV
jgi:hypothetical protein